MLPHDNPVFTSGRAFPKSDVHAAGLDRKSYVGCIFRLSAFDGCRLKDQVGEGQAVEVRSWASKRKGQLCCPSAVERDDLAGQEFGAVTSEKDG